MSLLKWNKVCKPKREGGLGIRPLKLMNAALLGKWLWRLGDDCDGLWKQILMAKHDILRDGWDPQFPKPRHSGTWRGILTVKEDFVSMIRCRVCMGERIHFWLNTGVGSSPLALQFPNLFNCASRQTALVRDYLSSFGSRVAQTPIFRRNFWWRTMINYMVCSLFYTRCVF